MIDLEFTAGFIAGFEGFVDHVYLDAVGVETVGYGETRRDVIERYRGGKISRGDALQLLKKRVQEFADAVEANVSNRSALTPQRHAALTSLAYNIGVAGFAGSTACRRFNAGDLDGACEAIGMWNKAGGRVLDGLARRRAAEMALFRGDGSLSSMSTTPAAPATSLLRMGASGDRVRDVQTRLAALGFPVAVDGLFGPGTADAVRSFQRARGLAADGIVGPATLAALQAGAGPPPAPGRMLRAGVEGDDVRQAQGRLGDWGWALVLDGLFGPKTDAAVRGFQQGEGVGADGVVGPATWSALWHPPRSRGGG